MDIELEKALTFIRDNARKYAEAKGERVYFEQFRKSKKALLMLDAEKKGVKTGQERESYAYSHPEYLALLTALQVAVEREEYLKLMIAGCNTKIDLWRTTQANMRSERSAYGA